MHTFCLLLHLHIYDTPFMLEISRNLHWIQVNLKSRCLLSGNVRLKMLERYSKAKAGLVCIFVRFFMCWSTCMLYLHAHCLFISLSPPSVQISSSGSNNNRVPQPDDLQPCFSLSPCSLSVSPIPLSVAGVTAGPDAAPGPSGFVVQMALSSHSLSASPPVCLLCAAVMCSCTLAVISIVMLI